MAMDTDPRISSTHCRTCQKPIIWAATRDGGRIAVDTEPIPDGNIRLVYRRGDILPLARMTALTERVNFGTDEPWYNWHTHKPEILLTPKGKMIA